MAVEVAQSLSQVKKDGRWQSFRHNTAPSISSSPPGSIPPRRSSLRTFRGRRPLAPIQEYKASPITTRSTGSLEDLIRTYHPTSWKSSSERLVLISESPQLQQIQSVSLSFSEESWRYEPAPKLYRTHSQWTRPPPAAYVPSGIPAFESSTSLQYQYTPNSEPTLSPETAVTPVLDEQDSSEHETEILSVGPDLPREDIAELFHRAEEYYRGHPEVVRESGKVWVRVNSVSHGLSKTLKTMGSLRKKKPSCEARLGRTIPVYSRLKCYEKPGRVKRMKIVLQDCWRKFRNWSTGRDTALQARQLAPATAHPMMNISVASLNTTPTRDTRPQMGHRRLSRAPKLEGWEAVAYRGHTRNDSKHSTYDEPLKRRRSSLFLDIYSTDGSVAG
ncbi:uncharacterized protein M421DRAFT_260865 [Didymella exigua CBS 183.55]|uniref:Uncharacterized protein n=1 Tax=Didymella exigua CBS 183.55 TaxID=1150837 RepID=A0A6A5RDA1_9PLEO|nr:uncharacterized protein M421DRAFT_260865 [Didymella exigua CBS 183.55]KAF1925198.1 hypothetical protein M421DRAFT_260865 [Didymella exigua CBS 183.55]